MMRKMGIHKELVNNGFKITSIDEEGGLLEQGYSGLLKSDIQNNQLNRLRQFLGGENEDTDSLKKFTQNIQIRFIKQDRQELIFGDLIFLNIGTHNK